MKTITTIALAAAFGVSAAGCGANVWSNIRQNEDGSYTMTYVNQGFFRTYGEVYRCEAQGPKKLVCRSIDRL